MSKWIEYQPILEELKHEWCNKCNKTCPYNNCKIYRVMQILARQKPIPHETERTQGEWYEYINKGVLKARHGDYVLYKVDYLLDNLAREVNIMEGARQMKGGAE